MGWTWDSTEINFADTNWTFDGWFEEVEVTNRPTAYLDGQIMTAARLLGAIR